MAIAPQEEEFVSDAEASGPTAKPDAEPGTADQSDAAVPHDQVDYDPSNDSAQADDVDEVSPADSIDDGSQEADEEADAGDQEQVKSAEEVKQGVAAQMRFGADGMEVDEETDTDLSDWGIHELGQQRETKYEQPQASEFGVDDRDTRSTVKEGSQEKLFHDVEDDQQTLTGGSAAGQSKW